jgi:predicted tellurium resistance membrane protein TerC
MKPHTISLLCFAIAILLMTFTFWVDLTDSKRVIMAFLALIIIFIGLHFRLKK